MKFAVQFRKIERYIVTVEVEAADKEAAITEACANLDGVEWELEEMPDEDPDIDVEEIEG